MAYSVPGFADPGIDFFVYSPANEGIPYLRADQVYWHDLCDPSQGSIHRACELQALPDHIIRGDGRAGRGLVYRAVLCFVLYADDLEGPGPRRSNYRGQGPFAGNAAVCIVRLAV